MIRMCKNKTFHAGFFFLLAILVVVSPLVNASEALTLRILHMNDVHSSIQDFGKIAAYVDSQRSSNQHFLFLNGGDIFSGDAVVDLQKGLPMIEILNAVGLDALTIGNHEFDYGQESFAQMVELSNFPWLGANVIVVDRTIPIKQPQPYQVFDLGEFTVGVLGLTGTPPATAPKGIVGIEFPDPITTAKQFSYVRDNVDILIGLTHMGFGTDQELASELDFFDLIIGGHSHTTTDEPFVVNGTPIVQAGGDGETVGTVTLHIDKESKQVVGVEGFNQSVEELTEVNSEVQALVDKHVSKVEELLSREIGYTNTGLSREGSGDGDVSLGNFWTDAMLYYADADVALTNNGGMRASIPAGPITMGDIYSIEPFQNNQVIFELTGKQLEEIMVYSYERKTSLDLQTGGLHYTVITDALGNLLDIELEVDGKPVDMNQTYRLVISDYLGSGGSGFTWPVEPVESLIGLVTTALTDYTVYLMEEKGAVDYGAEGRMQVIIDPDAEFEGTVIGSTVNGLNAANKDASDVGLGNLYTDAVRSVAGVQIGMLNNSSVSGELPAGDITAEQIESLDQYGNQVVAVEASGARIKEVILGQSNYNGGVDLQVSGLKYTLVKGEDQPFSDVLLFLEDGTELSLDQTYTVAYNDYMHGRNFYNVGEKIDSDYGTVWEAVVSYVQQQTEPIDYQEGDRISVQ